MHDSTAWGGCVVSVDVSYPSWEQSQIPLQKHNRLDSISCQLGMRCVIVPSRVIQNFQDFKNDIVIRLGSNDSLSNLRNISPGLSPMTSLSTKTPMSKKPKITPSSILLGCWTNMAVFPQIRSAPCQLDGLDPTPHRNRCNMFSMVHPGP